MRLDPRFLNWGVFFILLGAIPLAVSQGWIPASAIDNAWRFWPLILIGIGIGLLLRRTAFHFVGGLLVAATFGLMLGSVLAGSVNNDVNLRLRLLVRAVRLGVPRSGRGPRPECVGVARDELRRPDREHDLAQRLVAGWQRAGRPPAADRGDLGPPVDRVR